MNKITLKEIRFKKLKGLSNVTIKFSKPLTAIMGVNGSGKTTVIHALACLYNPDGNGENHIFPEFFTPNTDASFARTEVKELEPMVKSGKKRFVRYQEGAELYSMGLHTFEQLAKEAGAIYKIRRVVLVNLDIFDEYLDTFRM